MLKYILSAILSLSVAAPAFAQSQAINGTIEGTVTDTSGGVLPGVTVTVVNTDTGAERSVVTNEKGVPRVLEQGAGSIPGSITPSEGGR